MCLLQLAPERGYSYSRVSHMTDLLMQVSTPGRTWIFAAESAEDRVSWQSTLHMMLDDIRERKKRQVHLGHLSRPFISAIYLGCPSRLLKSRLCISAIHPGPPLTTGAAGGRDNPQGRLGRSEGRDAGEISPRSRRGRARDHARSREMAPHSACPRGRRARGRGRATGSL